MATPIFTAVAKAFTSTFMEEPEKFIKIVLLAVFIPLSLIAIIFVAPFAILKSVPMIEPTKVEIYKSVLDKFNKDKSVNLDWRNLAAIHAVIYNQDFNTANQQSIEDLANKFVWKEEKTSKDKNGKEKKTITWHQKDFDTVLNELLASGSISSVEEVKNFINNTDW